jgi:sigma-B regulation protein RsbQ
MCALFTYAVKSYSSSNKSGQISNRSLWTVVRIVGIQVNCSKETSDGTYHFVPNPICPAPNFQIPSGCPILATRFDLPARDTYAADSMSKIVICISFFIAIVGMTGCYQSDRVEEFAKYDPAKYEKVSINYEIHGKQDTTLIFIHDWNLDLTYWNEQVNKYKSQYRILNLDLAGHGNSGKGRTNWTAESFARDITNILQKESINKAILVGHSLGADVALHVHKVMPERIIGIIAIETFRNVDFYITEDFVDGLQDELSKFKRNYSEMADEFARRNIRSRNRDVINRIVADYKDADPKIALAIYKNMVPNHENEKEKLRELPFPIQIIVSDYAPFDEDALKRYARSGYEITWVYDAGHFPMVEQPQQFEQALEQSLRRITAQR